MPDKVRTDGTGPSRDAAPDLPLDGVEDLDLIDEPSNVVEGAFPDADDFMSLDDLDAPDLDVPDLDEATQALELPDEMPSFSADVAPAGVDIEPDFGAAAAVAVADPDVALDVDEDLDLDGKGLSSMGWLWWLIGAVLGIIILLFALSRCGGSDGTDIAATGDDTQTTTVTPTPDPAVAQRHSVRRGHRRSRRVERNRRHRDGSCTTRSSGAFGWPWRSEQRDGNRSRRRWRARRIFAQRCDRRPARIIDTLIAARCCRIWSSARWRDRLHTLCSNQRRLCCLASRGPRSTSERPRRAARSSAISPLGRRSRRRIARCSDLARQSSLRSFSKPQGPSRLVATPTPTARHRSIRPCHKTVRTPYVTTWPHKESLAIPWWLWVTAKISQSSRTTPQPTRFHSWTRSLWASTGPPNRSSSRLESSSLGYRRPLEFSGTMGHGSERSTRCSSSTRSHQPRQAKAATFGTAWGTFWPQASARSWVYTMPTSETGGGFRSGHHGCWRRFSYLSDGVAVYLELGSRAERGCQTPSPKSAQPSKPTTRNVRPARPPWCRCDCSTNRGSLAAGSSCWSRDVWQPERQPPGWPRSWVNEWVDLAQLRLELAVWGVLDPTTLALLDPLPTHAWNEAGEVLQMLGGLDGDFKVTERGRQLSQLPLHPRLGAIVLTGVERGIGAMGCALAALIDERDILRGRPAEVPTDLGLRLDLLTDRGRRHALARLRLSCCHQPDLLDQRDAVWEICQAIETRLILDALNSWYRVPVERSPGDSRGRPTPHDYRQRATSHTDEVLEELLGLSPAEVAGLHDRGVVAGPARRLACTNWSCIGATVAIHCSRTLSAVRPRSTTSRRTRRSRRISASTSTKTFKPHRSRTASSPSSRIPSVTMQGSAKCSANSSTSSESGWSKLTAARSSTLRCERSRECLHHRFSLAVDGGTLFEGNPEPLVRLSSLRSDRPGWQGPCLRAPRQRRVSRYRCRPTTPPECRRSRLHQVLGSTGPRVRRRRWRPQRGLTDYPKRSSQRWTEGRKLAPDLTFEIPILGADIGVREDSAAGVDESSWSTSAIPGFTGAAAADCLGSHGDEVVIKLPSQRCIPAPKYAFSTMTRTVRGVSSMSTRRGAHARTPAHQPTQTIATMAMTKLPTMDADWYVDPLGRFEGRFFDGEDWTAEVSNGGRLAVDPDWPPTPTTETMPAADQVDVQVPSVEVTASPDPDPIQENEPADVSAATAPVVHPAASRDPVPTQEPAVSAFEIEGPLRADLAVESPGSSGSRAR
ncbi:hypothetical protein GQR58_029574 [Nymphon striatum]|nr:hypothetical protein GQR58_029574 [Nymphon striatum]